MSQSVAASNASLAGWPATGLWIQAHSGDPGTGGTQNVVAGPTRGALSLATPSGGQRAAAAPFPLLTGVPGGTTVTNVSIWDAANGGTWWRNAVLLEPVSFSQTGALRLTGLTLTASDQSAVPLFEAPFGIASQSDISSDARVATEAPAGAIATGEQVPNPAILSSKPAEATTGPGVVEDSKTGGSQDISEAPAEAATQREAVVSPVGAVSIPAEAGTQREATVAPWTAPTTAAEVVAGVAGVGSSGAADSVSSDTTAPTVGTLSVTGCAAGAATSWSAGSSSDNVGITGWAIIDKATDSGWPTITSNGVANVTAGGGTWTSRSSSTPWTPSGSYTPATAGSPRYFKLYLRDAAGNVGASATASATISSGSTYSGPTVRAEGITNLVYNDILVAVTYGSITTPGAWTLKATGGNLRVYWMRYTGSAPPAMTGVLIGVVVQVSGCPTNGDPFEAASAVANGFAAASGIAVTANSLSIFAAVGYAADEEDWAARLSWDVLTTGPARSPASVYSMDENSVPGGGTGRYCWGAGIWTGQNAAATTTSSETPVASGVGVNACSCCLLSLKKA